MIKGVPMVTASVKIDVTTVGELCAMFTEWATRGHTTPVVDVSGPAQARKPERGPRGG
jgi:hypothetical protein